MEIQANEDKEQFQAYEFINAAIGHLKRSLWENDQKLKQ